MRIAFDTETHGLDWFDGEHAFLLTWSDATEDYLAHADDTLAIDAFLMACSKADEIWAHNLPFDVHQVRETWGIDLLELYGDKLRDTATLARVVLPERAIFGGGGFKLKDLAADLCDPAAKDSEDALKAVARQHGFALRSRGGYYKAWLAAPAVVETYAEMDTRLTYDLVDPLLEHLTPALTPTWDLERTLQPILIAAEARGVRVDPAKVAALRPSWLERRDRAYAKVVAVLGPDAVAPPDDPDAKDDHDLLAAKLIGHGVPLPKLPDSDKFATNKAALRTLAKDWPVLADLFEYRTARKFLATYIDPMHGREIVHPSIWQMGAKTGRTSMSRPNMQNIPVRGEGSSELREMFVPRLGHAFAVSDFDQIELRFLAYYLNDRAFQDKVASGQWDAFADLAARINSQFRFAPALGTSADGFRKGTPGEKYRGGFKNVVYAISYGAGGGKVHGMLTEFIDIDEGRPLTEDDWVVKKGFQKAGDPSYEPAREIISMVKSWLPGYDALMQRGSRYREPGRVVEKVERDGFVSTVNGRKNAVGKDKAYIGLNALIQGSAADVFKIAIILVAERTRHLGAIPLLFVHDEIGTECPVEHAEEVLAIQNQAMRDAWDLYPQLEVSGAIAERSYADAK